MHFREAKFQNFPGKHAPGPLYCIRAFSAPSYFCRTNSELLPPGLLLPMANTQYDITHLNYTKRCFFFSVKKGAPFLLYKNIYFKDYRHEVHSSLKCTNTPTPPPPPRRKSCVRAWATISWNIETEAIFKTPYGWCKIGRYKFHHAIFPFFLSAQSLFSLTKRVLRLTPQAPPDISPGIQ